MFSRCSSQTGQKLPILLANNSAETFENLGPRLFRRLSTALTRSFSSPVLIAACNIASESEAGRMKGNKTLHLDEGSDLDCLTTFY